MGDGGAEPTPAEIADLTNLSMGEMPLQISISEPQSFSTEGQPAGFNPELQAALDENVMDSIAEVETQPAQAAAEGGLLGGIPPPPPPPPPPMMMTQQTAAGAANIQPRERSMGVSLVGDEKPNFPELFFQQNRFGQAMVEDYDRILNASGKKRRDAIEGFFGLLKIIGSTEWIKRDPEKARAFIEKKFPAAFNV
jgi:hypothetical protein